jgi:hypothetical protein
MTKDELNEIIRESSDYIKSEEFKSDFDIAMREAEKEIEILGFKRKVTKDLWNKEMDI